MGAFLLQWVIFPSAPKCGHTCAKRPNIKSFLSEAPHNVCSHSCAKRPEIQQFLREAPHDGGATFGRATRSEKEKLLQTHLFQTKFRKFWQRRMSPSTAVRHGLGVIPIPQDKRRRKEFLARDPFFRGFHPSFSWFPTFLATLRVESHVFLIISDFSEPFLKVEMSLKTRRRSCEIFFRAPAHSDGVALTNQGWDEHVSKFWRYFEWLWPGCH